MHSLKTLLVEDSPAQVLAVHQLLNACGVFNVSVAEHLKATRQKLTVSGSFDIAICGSLPNSENRRELINALAATGKVQALILRGDAQAPELASAARLATQTGLWVLGSLPDVPTTRPLHMLLERYWKACGGFARRQA